ncbi:hypothetical protein DIZ27_10420 [Streptomyces sp. NWU339]|uniref:hypothetical protein n=1 Tax=Streptomyces sp. NWU339 TaxID=2185284 RepID=UPI000D672E02|nr:hypothetical protein [Streptomyces sp. NWU339]PWI10798.1 hypothetical protein DIZ27_10420 [Streptomyces sp. NWU339]
MSSHSPRSARSPFIRRLPISLAVGALALATAVTPAVASDRGDDGGQANWSQQGGNGHNNGDGNGNGNGNGHGGNQQGGGNGYGNQQGGGNGNGHGNNQQGGGNGNGHGNNQQGGGNGNHDGDNQAGGNHGDRGKFKGVVTAHSLALRSSPHRGSRVIRYAHKGEVLSIYCKAGGDSVQGNSLWYLLTDGTWAWGPARHIDNIGPAPRWC